MKQTGRNAQAVVVRLIVSSGYSSVNLRDQAAIEKTQSALPLRTPIVFDVVAIPFFSPTLIIRFIVGNRIT
jgi:hypothetical protein